MLNFPANRVQLFFLGVIILFWELLFIRWTGASIRIVAYFSNFILISAFLGLGAGSLMARFDDSLKKYLIPFICLYLASCPVLGSFFHENPKGQEEYIWIGSALTENLSFLGFEPQTQLPYWLLLAVPFVFNTVTFVIFGQWLGHLFKEESSLEAYSSELAGSIVGILLFSLMALLSFSPTYWVVVGFLFLFLCLKKRKFFL